MRLTALVVVLPVTVVFGAPQGLTGSPNVQLAAGSDGPDARPIVVTPTQEPSDGSEDEQTAPDQQGERAGSFKLSDTGVGDIPSAALRAYRSAASTLAASHPACNLDWTVLAAIGKVESDHGRYAGSEVDSEGVSHPQIIGVPLNGIGPVAAIADTDEGSLDGDQRWDRAVGPMQFIPSTWNAVGVDGDGDGVRNPHDIDDAALSAATYLCAGGGDLSTTRDLRAAIYSYNHSDEYVAMVLELAKAYSNGDFDVVPTTESQLGDMQNVNGSLVGGDEEDSKDSGEQASNKAQKAGAQTTGGKQASGKQQAESGTQRSQNNGAANKQQNDRNQESNSGDSNNGDGSNEGGSNGGTDKAPPEPEPEPEPEPADPCEEPGASEDCGGDGTGDCESDESQCDDKCEGDESDDSECDDDSEGDESDGSQCGDSGETGGQDECNADESPCGDDCDKDQCQESESGECENPGSEN